MNLRQRILAVTIPINVIAITCIFLIVRTNAYRSVESLTNEHTRNLLSSAMLTIENQYTSLQYHREYTTNLRKKERQQIVGIAASILRQYHNEYLQGRMTMAEAQRKAIEKISAFRYDDGNGYIWINDTERPIPRIIYHPIYTEFIGRISDDPLFYTSRDSVNVTVLAANLCENQGSGFIEYMWKKPTESGDRHDQPKTSYVEIFEPWQWVMGAGVYLEDIEEDVNRRLDAILDELKQTMGKMELGETGYFYIINSNRDMILHPIIRKPTPDSVMARLLETVPFEQILEAGKSADKTLEYSWYSPLSGEQNSTHRKKVFIEYFEPLDWYVCASFYHAELEAPGHLLGRKILLISALFILISLVATIYLSNSITRPLDRLMKFVAGIPGNFRETDPGQVPDFRSRETNALGNVLKEMLISIKQQQENLLEEKSRAEKSEARMRDSEEKYRLLYESSNDAIFLIRDKKIISCNQKTLDLFGRSEEEIIGVPPSSLSPEYQYDGRKTLDLEDKILAGVLTGNPAFFEWKHIRPDGEIFDCAVSLSLVELKNEHYVQAAVRDITEKKKNETELEAYRTNLEKLVESRTAELNRQNEALKQALDDLKEMQGQLVQAEKMASLGILTAGVAHEINNPINFIQNGADALQTLINSTFPDAREEYQPLLDAIFTGVGRITEIVRSLGKYSRSQNDDIIACDVHEVIDNCLTMLHNQYKYRIEIKKAYAEILPEIMANEGELHQVFLNILSNAIQAIPDKGVVRIRTGSDDRAVSVEIEDNGKGIPHENLKHIFDPFFTTKEPGNGIGLGLSITKKLVENQLGTITCTSESGKGTAFRITLPLETR